MAMKFHPLFIAASNQHVGKTTSTLGLLSLLREKGYDVGFCKPVGQETVIHNGMRVDKDAQLFSSIMEFPLEPDVHSPVLLFKGVTSEYLDAKVKPDLPGKVEKAAASLAERHRVLLFEGTGHPGVGSIVGLSNADVAARLKAKVILIVEGGIGRTVDRLNLCISFFRDRGVEISGVVVNKVYQKKMDTVRHYVGHYLDQLGIPLLAIIPYDKILSFPILDTIRDAVKGKVILNEHMLDNHVEDILAGSLVGGYDYEISHHLLLVVNRKRIPETLKELKQTTSFLGIEQNVLSGILVAGDVDKELDEADLAAYREYLGDIEVPVLTTSLDTYGSVLKVKGIEVKINTKTPWKAKRAMELFDQYLDIEALEKILVVEE